jgi:ATP-dependent helicase YprA (DUF1998 family)
VQSTKPDLLRSESLDRVQELPSEPQSKRRVQAGFSEQLMTEIAKKCDYEIVARAQLDERAPRYSPIPETLGPKIRGFIESNYPNGLFTHQAEAIKALLGGSDVCLATSTASGKSLVFDSYRENLKDG